MKIECFHFAIEYTAERYMQFHVITAKLLLILTSKTSCTGNRIRVKERTFLWLIVAMPNVEHNEGRQPCRLYQTFDFHQMAADQQPILSICR